MAQAWRLILDGKLDGPCNMATDETLLYAYEATGIPALRIYGWQAPYISLGYNQDPEQVLKKGRTTAFVRRLTGGSAILHDQEITYSVCCLRQDLNLSIRVKDSYRELCVFLIDFYRRLGLRARFARDVGELKGFGHYGNFCFSSCEHFDLVIGGRKIGGNAQRRRHDLIFQHGSIPQTLDFSRIRACINDEHINPHVCGALDILLGRPTDFSRLQEMLAESFRETFSLDCQPSALTSHEADTRDYLVTAKYSSPAWNYHRENVSIDPVRL
ncbi:MAG: lipoate--protein ligase family protein [Candidatus Omnitrophota bacterium]|nr:lipoate--protein ligase family protein [Candidatus Omnitrophota bacterium]